jgi:DNA-binding winged helix-turn-helix (wHTH) protein/alpha-beta hydrolase superfamily lysophospholipase
MSQFRFADCVLDLDRRQLVRDGRPVRIEPQVFDLLRLLVERAGHVVSKQEILDDVWHGRIVSDDALTSRIKAARRAIGDDGRAQQLIRTVHRVGYRFCGDEEVYGRGDGGPSPEVRFFNERQGRRMAYSRAGSGPLVVCPAWWVSNVVKDLENPDVARFLARLGEGVTLVRYDRPGTGLSDRNARSEGLSDEVNMLEDLVAELGVPRVSLFGMSTGGPIAIAYAATHADMVDRLCLYGSFAYGPELCSVEVQSAMLAAVRAHWGLGSRALAEAFLPDGDRAALEASARQQRAAAQADVAADLLAMTYTLDVRPLLGNIRAETLILHREKDRSIPFECARQLASGIPGARLAVMEGSAHLPWQAGDEIASRTNDFLLGRKVH